MGTHFSSGENVSISIGPFNLTLLCHYNDTLISTAVVNVSTSINGRTIECRNALPVNNASSTITQHINFSVKSMCMGFKVAPYSIFGCSALEVLNKILIAMK